MCYKEDTLELVRENDDIDVRHLATAVFCRALADATEHEPILNDWCVAPSWNDVIEAQQFLTTDTEDLRFWCECIGVIPEYVISHAKLAIQSGSSLSYDELMSEQDPIGSGV